MALTTLAVLALFASEIFLGLFHTDSVALLESFRALKLTLFESFRALKS